MRYRTESVNANEIANGILSALVSITAGCAFVDYWGAVFIGCKELYSRLRIATCYWMDLSCRNSIKFPCNLPFCGYRDPTKIKNFSEVQYYTVAILFSFFFFFFQSLELFFTMLAVSWSTNST